jgi:hypothetical protein
MCRYVYMSSQVGAKSCCQARISWVIRSCSILNWRGLRTTAYPYTAQAAYFLHISDSFLRVIGVIILIHTTMGWTLHKYRRYDKNTVCEGRPSKIWTQRRKAGIVKYSTNLLTQTLYVWSNCIISYNTTMSKTRKLQNLGIAEASQYNSKTTSEITRSDARLWSFRMHFRSDSY